MLSKMTTNPTLKKLAALTAIVGLSVMLSGCFIDIPFIPGI